MEPRGHNRTPWWAPSNGNVQNCSHFSRCRRIPCFAVSNRGGYNRSPARDTRGPIGGLVFHRDDERQRSMSRFFAYDPNQAYLLPPNVKDVLGGEHLCFRLHAMVEQFDLSQFEQAYAAEGRLAYPPSMMLKVWLYAF